VFNNTFPDRGGKSTIFLTLTISLQKSLSSKAIG